MRTDKNEITGVHIFPTKNNFNVRETTKASYEEKRNIKNVTFATQSNVKIYKKGYDKL